MDSTLKQKRTFKLKFEDNSYTIPSKGLIESWTIKPTSDVQKKLLLDDDIKIKIDNLDLYFEWHQSREDPLFFSLKQLRTDAWNIDEPNGERDDQIINLDRILCAEQIKAQEYYPHLKSENFWQSVFTYSLVLKIQTKFNLGVLEIEEIYYPRTPGTKQSQEEEQNRQIDKIVDQLNAMN